MSVGDVCFKAVESVCVCQRGRLCKSVCETDGVCVGVGCVSV